MNISTLAMMAVEAPLRTLATAFSEIRLGERHGGTLVGPLPAAIQRYTVHDAVVMSWSRASDAARAFIGVISAPTARQTLAATGWEF